MTCLNQLRNDLAFHFALDTNVALESNYNYSPHLFNSALFISTLDINQYPTLAVVNLNVLLNKVENIHFVQYKD